MAITLSDTLGSDLENQTIYTLKEVRSTQKMGDLNADYVTLYRTVPSEGPFTFSEVLRMEGRFLLPVLEIVQIVEHPLNVKLWVLPIVGKFQLTANQEGQEVYFFEGVVKEIDRHGDENLKCRGSIVSEEP